MATKEQKEMSQSELLAKTVTDAVLKTHGVSGLVNMQPITNGVLITNLFGNVEIEIYLRVYYGCNIPEVSWNIQERVKKALSDNELPEAKHINIHIEGVDLKDAGKDQ